MGYRGTSLIRKRPPPPIYCQTTSVSAAHAAHYAAYCTPCRPLIRALSEWIRTPFPINVVNGPGRSARCAAPPRSPRLCFPLPNEENRFQKLLPESHGQNLALNVLYVPHSVYGEIGIFVPNTQRQRRACYALCHILYPVSAARMSIFRMNSNSTSYVQCREKPGRWVRRGGLPSSPRPSASAAAPVAVWGLGVGI